MRNHVQGVVLLMVLVVGVWAAARAVLPGLDFGFVAEEAVETGEAEDVVDLSSADDALTADELQAFQWFLTNEGYDTKGVDGVMGPATRAAIQQAIEGYGLPPTTSDRGLLEHMIAVSAGNAADTAVTDTAADTAVADTAADTAVADTAAEG